MPAGRSIFTPSRMGMFLPLDCASPQSSASLFAQTLGLNIAKMFSIVAGSGATGIFSFTSPVRGKQQYSVTGVTRDSNGIALGNCVVEIFTTSDDIKFSTQTSDASGNFSFKVPSNGWSFYMVAYLPGSPDVFGTTVNTITGT